jgi:hypothetical protein
MAMIKQRWRRMQSTINAFCSFRKRVDSMARNQHRKPIRMLLLSLMALVVLSSPLMAQQQAAPPAAPSVQQQAAPPPSPATQQQTAPPPAPSDQGKRSKLEQETGTVNDRFFEVMPNYGTVEGATELPPITAGQKFRLATAGVFDYTTFPFIGFLAAIDQANNSPKSWGQGWGAYGQRYGEQFADNGIGTYMTTAIFPSLLHEDPRYYQRRTGSFGSRVWYPISRLFITRTDSGDDKFNYSEIIGNGVAAGISNIYHPAEDRTVSRNLGTWGMLIMWDGASNEMKEFWPDIRRKVFHKQTP